MSFTGNIFGSKPSSGSFPTEPPSPVKLGNTLIVSIRGTGAGVREDVAFHFDSIDAAIAAYQTGDVILIYPGVYIMTPLVVSQDLYIYGMPGVVIQNEGGDFLFSLLDGYKVVVEGNIQFNLPIGSFIIADHSLAKLELECKSIDCGGGFGFLLGDGNYNIRIKDKFSLLTDSCLGFMLSGIGDPLSSSTLIYSRIVKRNIASDIGAIIFYQTSAGSNVIVDGDYWQENSNGSAININSCSQTQIRVNRIENIYNGSSTRNICTDNSINSFGAVVHISGGESTAGIGNVIIESNLFGFNKCKGIEVSWLHDYNIVDPALRIDNIKFNGNISTTGQEAIFVLGGFTGRISFDGTFTTEETGNNTVKIGHYDGVNEYFICKYGHVELSGLIKGNSIHQIIEIDQFHATPADAIQLLVNANVISSDHTTAESIFSQRDATVVVKEMTSNRPLNVNITEVGSSAIIDNNYF